MWVLVLLAGGFGAAARAAVHAAMHSRSATAFPLGTFVVNVVGSLALGVVVGLVLAQGVDRDVQTIAGTGFLGAFTTFSAFSYETFALVEDGAATTAVAYVVGSVFAGAAAAAVGLALTGAL